MKKFIMLVAGVIMSLNVLAGTVGYVDLQDLLDKYPETKKTQDYLEKKKKDLQIVLDAEKTKINDKSEELKKKGDKATKAEKDELEKTKTEFQKKFETMQANLEQLQYTMYDKLYSDINVAIQEIAKEKKLDIVVNKTAIYYGGEDITEDVLKFLAGVQKIDLK